MGCLERQTMKGGTGVLVYFSRFVSCRACFLFAANNRLICTADTLESVSSSTVQLMIRAFCDFSLRSCFLIGVVEI